MGWVLTWGLIAGATVAVGGAVLSGQAQNKAALGAYAGGAQNEALAWTQNIADNKAIAEANLQNMIRTGYKTGLMNIQRAQSKKQAAEAGISLNRSALQLKSAATANSAAAGAIGTSVDAVLLDIASKTQEAQNNIDVNYIQQEENFDVQLHDILSAGIDSQRAAASINVRQTPDADTSHIGANVLGALVNVAGSYVSSKMSLGLGNTSNRQVGSSGGGVLSAFNTTNTGVA